MRGQTTIQLKDVNTGEITEITKNNMITNAFARVFGVGMLPYSSSTSGFATGTTQDLLKGILLFEDAQPESVDHTEYKGDNKLIGHAGKTAYTGTSSIRGNFNNGESYFNADEIRLVWDFTTNQANGTISSLSLTDGKSGDTGFGRLVEESTAGYYGLASVKQSGQETISGISSGCVFNNRYYWFVWNSSSKTVVIKSVRVQQSVVSPVNITLPIVEEVTVNVPDLASTQHVTGFWYQGKFCVKDAYISVQSGELFTWFEIDLETFEVTKKQAVNQFDTAVSNNQVFSHPEFTVNNTGLLIYNNGEQLQTPLIATPTVFSKNALSIGSQNFNVVTKQFFSGSFVNLQNENNVYVNGSSHILRYYGAICPLMTVNNISAVTKTEAQTMKVIYTLTNL